MTLVVSDNDAVGLSFPSRLVRGRRVRNTVGIKYQKQLQREGHQGVREGCQTVQTC